MDLSFIDCTNLKHDSGHKSFDGDVIFCVSIQKPIKIVKKSTTVEITS